MILDYRASAYASVMMVITAVFLLITAQLAVTSSELNISHMHERYSGLYEIGVSAAEARTKEMNHALLDAENDILREYMERDDNDWINQYELRDGALVLTGGIFWAGYQQAAMKYIQYLPQVLKNPVTITQESGIKINVAPKFGDPGTQFAITVTNSSDRPFVKNMADNAVEIQGKIIWNPDPPVFILQPRFNINEDTLDGKGFNDFIITCDPDYSHFILKGIHQA